VSDLYSETTRFVPEHCTSDVINISGKYPQSFQGTRGRLVDSGTTLQAGRSRFRFPIRSLDFSIDLIPPAALCPWGRLSL
jgi:hypothetical protein